MAAQLSISSVLVYFSCLYLLFAAFSSANFDGEPLEPSLLNIGNGFSCEFAKCLRGQCVNDSSFPFYKCECNAGWKPPFGVAWLPCILPNCSIDLTCANSSSAVPAPSPTLPSFNGSPNICSLPVCGNGVCSSAGNSSNDYECKCDTGYANLRNKSDGYCIRSCSIGADCTNVNLPIGGTRHAPPPPSLPSPVSSSSPNSSQGTSPSPSTPSQSTSTSKGQVNKLQDRLLFAASFFLVIMWA
eukprot:c22511_g1_i2 orf=320-1045(-)